MAEAKTIMKGELTISPDAFNTLVKLKEELEEVIETIEIMNEKQKRLHHRLWLPGLTFSFWDQSQIMHYALPITDHSITDHALRITDH
jgi:hypothetical protein